MNKIEQMHLNVIKDSYHTYKLDEEDSSIVDTLLLENKAVSKSAEITEKIAIEFAGWIGNHSYQKTVDGLWTNNWGISQDTTKELYQKFLKTQK